MQRESLVNRTGVQLMLIFGWKQSRRVALTSVVMLILLTPFSEAKDRSAKDFHKSKHGHPEQGTEQFGQGTDTSSVFRTLEILCTSAEWQPCIWLNPAVSAERTMKCMNKALWGSAGSLIYYIHVKPPTFILHIAQIQQRIWFGLTYFISIFST